MSPRKRKDETESGLWSVAVGEHGFVVRAREKTRGGQVVLDHKKPDGTRWPKPTHLRVRDADGKIDENAASKLLEEARDLSARLRLERRRTDVEPQKVTVGDGHALFHDPDRGGMPKGWSSRKHHFASRRFWLEVLGKDTPWNLLTPADIKAAVAPLVARGMVQTADKRVKNLRTVYRWLTGMKDIQGLKDPTRNFNFKELWEGYEPRQPRYSQDELRRLLVVRHEVDPRFALMLIFARGSGARSMALYTAMRSMIDQKLDVEPTPDQAPFGWANLPGMKGQGRALTYLTLRQRIEFAHAIGLRWNGVRWVPGFLSELERRYQEHGEDYPLIPGGRLPRDRVIKHVTEISGQTPINWLIEAEKKAGIKHEVWRDWHGVRRAWGDYTYIETDLDTVTEAGAWSDPETPRKIYLSRLQHSKLARSREAQERNDE